MLPVLEVASVGFITKVDLQVAIPLLLSKVAVLILLVASPGKGLGELFGPRLLCGAGTQLLLVLLIHTQKRGSIEYYLIKLNIQ